MDGLLVRQPYADLLARGEKTWEIRVGHMTLPEQFYILSTTRPFPDTGPYDPGRLGAPVGIGKRGPVFGPYRVEELGRYQRKHRASLEGLTEYARGRKVWAYEIHGVPIAPRAYVMQSGPVRIIRDVQPSKLPFARPHG